jgi:3D (Asp-Asp-Asp) domain-containing protein
MRLVHAGILSLGCTVLAAAPVAAQQKAATKPGSSLTFTATAYCQAGKTQSGTTARTGIVAADPHVLPVGSVVRVDVPRAYAGIYTVLDTGAAVNGRHLDIFVPDCARAQRFGRQKVRVHVLRRGWDPKASAPSE